MLRCAAAEMAETQVEAEISKYRPKGGRLLIKAAIGSIRLRVSHAECRCLEFIAL